MKMENKKFSHKHYRQHYDTRSILRFWNSLVSLIKLNHFIITAMVFNVFRFLMNII